ncbi:hypothetical protein M885DRAFT_615793, partial [Pelagophyceae sp. CCMP2097]
APRRLCKRVRAGEHGRLPGLRSRRRSRPGRHETWAAKREACRHRGPLLPLPLPLQVGARRLGRAGRWPRSLQRASQRPVPRVQSAVRTRLYVRPDGPHHDHHALRSKEGGQGPDLRPQLAHHQRVRRLRLLGRGQGLRRVPQAHRRPCVLRRHHPSLHVPLLRSRLPGRRARKQKGPLAQPPASQTPAKNVPLLRRRDPDRRARDQEGRLAEPRTRDRLVYRRARGDTSLG